LHINRNIPLGSQFGGTRRAGARIFGGGGGGGVYRGPTILLYV